MTKDRKKVNVFELMKKKKPIIQLPKYKMFKLKKKKYSTGGSVYTGSAIKTEYGGKKLSNKSYEKYYKGMI